MKFITLLKNELRTAVPWILLAIAAMVLVGGFIIYAEYMWQQENFMRWHYGAGEQIDLGRLSCRSPMSGLGPWLFFSSM